MTPTLAPAFSVSLAHSGAMTIIAPSGELDLAVAAQFRAGIAEALSRNPLVVAIDLRGLDFLDASGIAAVLDCAERCGREGRRFFVVRGGPEVQSAVAAAHVDGLLEMVDQLDHADDGHLSRLPV